MKRGPKSAAELVVVSQISDARPVAPARLTPEEQEVWCLTASRLPGSWFTAETLPLLEAYCAHTATARRYTALVNSFENEWLTVEGGVERLGKLAAMRERETRAATSIARALRITKSAQTEPHSAYRAARDAIAGPRPWD